MNEKLANFLLYNVSDDWAAIGEFDGTVEKVAPEGYSRAHVLGVIAELARRGDIEIGAFPGGGRSWEPWRVDVDEAVRRIAEGYNGEAGYLALPEDAIGSSEISGWLRYMTSLTPIW